MVGDYKMLDEKKEVQEITWYQSYAFHYARKMR
jgi:hypothetical protein